MMGRFLRTGFVWVRRVNNSRNFHPSRSLGHTCKAHTWRTLQKTFMMQQPFGTQIDRIVGRTLEATAICRKTAGAFWEAKAICCPKTFPMAGDPRANAVGEKCQKEFSNWETSLKWWVNLPQNLFGSCPREKGTPQNLKNLGATLVHPCRNLRSSPRQSAPENDRHHKTCGTLVEPWQNLGGTFRGAFWRPKTNRTTESPKAILPRNLHYGWKPESYCCWWKMTDQSLFNAQPKEDICMIIGTSFQTHYSCAVARPYISCTFHPIAQLFVTNLLLQSCSKSIQ